MRTGEKKWEIEKFEEFKKTENEKGKGAEGFRKKAQPKSEK